jgi:hypothetical protein
VARRTQELRPVMTRIPETLRRRLERAAARNNRSMNTEIIHRLEESFALDSAARAGAAAARRDLKSLSETEIGEKLDKMLALLESGQPKDQGGKK